MRQQRSAVLLESERLPVNSAARSAASSAADVFPFIILDCQDARVLTLPSRSGFRHQRRRSPDRSANRASPSAWIAVISTTAAAMQRTRSLNASTATFASARRSNHFAAPRRALPLFKRGLDGDTFEMIGVQTRCSAVIQPRHPGDAPRIECGATSCNPSASFNHAHRVSSGQPGPLLLAARYPRAFAAPACALSSNCSSRTSARRSSVSAIAMTPAPAHYQHFVISTDAKRPYRVLAGRLPQYKQNHLLLIPVPQPAVNQRRQRASSNFTAIFRLRAPKLSSDHFDTRRDHFGHAFITTSPTAITPRADPAGSGTAHIRLGL